MWDRKLARALAISGVVLFLSACSFMDSEDSFSEGGMTDTETSLAESNATDSDISSVILEPQLQTEVADSSSYEPAWQKFDELVKWPIEKPLELTVEEKAQINKFIEQNKSLLEEKFQSTYLSIFVMDVTGDGCPEIVLFYLKNGDQQPEDLNFYRFSGIGEVYDLETFAYMGDLYGDPNFDIGWYQEDNSKKCYSLEENISGHKDHDGCFQVYNMVYVLWEIEFDGQKIDCSPRWVYATQRTYELIEGEDYIKEECFSIDSPDKEVLIAWRIDPDRPFDVLRKSSTPGLSNEIKESLASLQPVVSYWTLYAFINSEGELVIK